MKINARMIKALILIGVLMITGLAHGWSKKTTMSKGANKPMKTYYIGRFSIAVPAEMEEVEGSRSHQLRYVEMKEIVWPSGINHEQLRETEWHGLMTKLKELSPPEGEKKVIIQMHDFPNVGKWAKGVFYYDYYGRPRTATWALLMDTGPIGIWFKTPPVVVEKENVSNKSVRNLDNIGKFYHVIDLSTSKPKGDWFYLNHGAINLPYSAQEKSGVRFEKHPLNLKIEVEMDMDKTYKRETVGLIEKSEAMTSSGYAVMAHVKTKNIRSQKRLVAGMPGEEVIYLMKSNGESKLSFGWEYNGKDDSGEYPETLIKMETPDGNLDEKLKIWDAVLDSMKPMFVRKK